MLKRTKTRGVLWIALGVLLLAMSTKDQVPWTSDQREIRALVPRLLTRLTDIQAIAPDRHSYSALALNDALKKLRVQRYRSLWEPEQVSVRETELENAIQESASSPSYLGFSDYQLKVDHWVSTYSDGSTARAVFEGSESYLLWSGHWTTPKQGRWQVDLVRGGAYGWQLSDIVSSTENQG